MDFKNVFNKALVSPATKTSYIEKMAQIMKLYNNRIPSVNDLADNDELSINKKFQYIGALLAYNKHSSIETSNDDRQTYRDIQELMNFDKNAPTDKQLINKLTYNEAIEKLNELINNKNYSDALLLSMYVIVPPVRSNYGSILIADKAHHEIYELNKLSHLYNNKIYLYDLKVNKGKEHIIILPDQVKNIINELNPEKYLFTNKNGNNMTNRQFSVWANTRLNDIFKKNITLTHLRHIYINNLDMNKLTSADKSKIAKQMNHSTNMQDKYRIIY